MIISGKDKIDQIRTLITSVEFELTPCKNNVMDFVPDRQDIMIKLFYIREATKTIERDMLENWPV